MVPAPPRAGKTLVFVLPMLLISLQEEMRFPLGQNEGPVALCICPSRELATQTHGIADTYAKVSARGGVRSRGSGRHTGAVPKACV